MLSRFLVPRSVPRSVARRPRGFAPLAAARTWGEFDRLFDQLWRGPGAAGPAGFQPRIDVHEDEDEIRVRAELPGLEEKDFRVSVEADLLSIEGEKREEHEEQREGCAHLETRCGSFRRVIRLPWEVEYDSVQAAYKNGILTVTLPKPAAARPQVREIPVSAG